MALDKQRTYMVLNYSSSPVSIITKDRGYMLEGGTREQPYVLPLTLDEINTANTNGFAFKYGCAFFEPEFEKAIYEELRMLNWEDILHDEQIEDIILHPTKECLEKLIAIDNEIYFGRVYGIYMGLKSIFAEISPRVELVIEQRRDELKVNQRKTEIVLSKPIPKADTTSADIAELKAKLAQFEDMLSAKSNNEVIPPVKAETVDSAVTESKTSPKVNKPSKPNK